MCTAAKTSDPAFEGRSSPPRATATRAGYFNAPGRLSSVGNNGFGWSSATSGIYGLHLSFYVTWLDPKDILHRGHGLQLRCLSE
ncbi:hypothetical protein [uncultured Rikenella sp.]|uniref:hypothetical protein n=1 Tax=uncultured Rikenella sp. TaxID=368003 RepID=UPI0026203C57|nr:hypothetical protein [uncultured Rikenella sp.]